MFLNFESRVYPCTDDVIVCLLHCLSAVFGHISCYQILRVFFLSLLTLVYDHLTDNPIRLGANQLKQTPGKLTAKGEEKKSSVRCALVYVMNHLLVFDLVVQVPREPIVKK